MAKSRKLSLIGVTVIRCLALRLGDAEWFPPLRIALAPEFIERLSTAPPGSRSWQGCSTLAYDLN